MIVKIFGVLLFAIALFGIETLQPSKSFKASGDVQSMVMHGKLLYAGTSEGTVDVFHLDSKKKLQTIQLPKIKDFTGEHINPKIYSVDFLDDALLIVSQGLNGFRDLYIFKNKKLEKIFSQNNKLLIQKASFVSKDHLLVGLLSNQIGLFDMKNRKQIYLVQLSQSSFSHFMLSGDKKTFASTDESGVVRIVDTLTGKVVKQLPPKNLDKIYQLDYKNGVILTAGQDRKSVVYKNNSAYSLDFDFLLYSCALNSKGDLGAVAYNEQNEVLVFDLATKTYLYNLVGQEATMTQILFVSENELLVSSDSQKVNYFKLGGKK